MIEVKSWPTAVVLSVALLAIATVVLAGPSLGVDPATTRIVLGGIGSGSALILAAMRGLWHE